MTKPVSDLVREQALNQVSARVNNRMLGATNDLIADHLAVRLWNSSSNEVFEHVLHVIKIPNVIESAKESLSHSPEGKAWDRLDEIVEDSVSIRVWERIMLPEMDHVFNRIFNHVEEDEVSPVIVPEEEEGDG